MFENTNQAEISAEETTMRNEGILPYSLFEEEKAPFLTVKFNGEEQNLSLDAAKTYAQKGMNYDRIFDKWEQARNTLDALAASEGITKDELMAKLNGADITRLRWEGLLKEYPDLDVETLDDSVFLQVDRGLSPIEAYQKHLINELSAKLSQKENEMRTMGSIETMGDTPRDNFLDGFFGAKY